MSKESLKKSLEQEPKKDEVEAIQKSDMEINLEDLDKVAGGDDPSHQGHFKDWLKSIF